jgi:hypothetical protein
MKWTPWLVGSLAAMAMTACGGNKANKAAANGGGAESGTMQGGAATTTDTGMARTDTTSGGMSGMSSDTAKGAKHDSSASHK